MNFKKISSALAVFSLCAVSLAPIAGPGLEVRAEAKEFDAVYLGVYNYGSPDVDKDHIEDFKYRFKVDGKEEIYTIDNGAPQADGNPAYPIQNQLKEGYSYRIQVDEDVVKKVAEKRDSKKTEIKTAVSGEAGKKTLVNFLKNALEPVGTTLYIYGGGWNWQDDASGIQARTIDVCPEWVKFFNEHGMNYTYRDKDGDSAKKNPATSYYPYGAYNEYYYAGLDCSGYVGWVLYNTMYKKDGKQGFVDFASDMAKNCADEKWGKWTKTLAPAGKGRVKPGDIISLSGHIWIGMGECEDGSVVIAHSTPSDSRTGQPGGGVQLSAIGKSTKCQAYKLADKYMSNYYKKWYRRYPVALKSEADYFEFKGDDTGIFRWYTNGKGALSDKEGIQDMSAEEALELLFE